MVFKDDAVGLVPYGSVAYRNVPGTVKYNVDISIELLVLYLILYTKYGHIEQRRIVVRQSFA